MQIAIQLFFAFAGSLGFVLLFNVRGKRIFPAALGGLLSWGVYLLAGFLTKSDVARYFIASITLTFYAEFMAHRMKSPATLFLVSAAVPLIPGGMLYSTMGHAIDAEWDAFFYGTLETLMLTMAIAGGILFGMTIFQIIKRLSLKGSRAHRRIKT